MCDPDKHDWHAVDTDHLYICFTCGHHKCTCRPDMVSAKPLYKNWRELRDKIKGEEGNG